MPIIPILILNLALCLPYLALAQSPVPQIDGKCPTGAMKSGDYCVPKLKPGSGRDSYIVRRGNSCPYGYFKEGNYCRKGTGKVPESMPRKPGTKCPHGWYKSGDYCWKGAGAR